MATRTWSSTGSTDLNNAANYSGSGALLTTDDLVFDSTSTVSASASANLDVASISATNQYSGNLSFAGYTATYETGNVSFQHTGTLNLGNGLTVNGASAVVTIASGVGTVTASSCIFTFNGTTGMTLTENKGIQTVKKLVLGASAVLTYSSTNNYGTYYRGDLPLVLNDNCHFTTNKRIRFQQTITGTLASIGSNVVWDGTGDYVIFESFGSAITTSIPGITYTGSGIVNIRNGTYLNQTIRLTGNINVGTSDLEWYGNTYGDCVGDCNGYNITCGKLSLGDNQSSGTWKFYFRSGTFTITSFVSNYWLASGATTIDMGTASINCAGSWTFKNTNTINPNASTVTITNTATITTATRVFFNIVINATGKTITLADDLRCFAYTLTAGSVNQAGHSILTGLLYYAWLLLAGKNQLGSSFTGMR